ncbi:hypothetical protein CQA66_08375 [Helicobacter aurati]|uniref:Uncharacterized protein n=1 Tax=Helicobacter aurati TaxID=137778 RepID=A0A3D8J0P5_9HELI|nr:hypothetical protein [Helicobacter aurati]RDU70414.1 hypothetical protein CQA66_08375 [Helicobacter aurati]
MFKIKILDKVGLKIPTILNTITLKGNKETILSDSEYQAIKDNQIFKDMINNKVIIIEHENIKNNDNENTDKKRGRPKQEKD